MRRIAVYFICIKHKHGGFSVTGAICFRSLKRCASSATRKPCSVRGGKARTIFDALRGNPEGLDVASLAGIAATANNLDMNDALLAPIVRARVNNAPYRYMNKGEAFNRKGRDGIRERRLAP